MGPYRRIVIVFLTVVMTLGPEWPLFIRTLYAQPAKVNPPRTSVPFKPLVDQLLAATTDTTDTDNDGLPDSVETIIGTDPNNTDSDFDKLNDLWEINNNLDPMEPDSNFDGLPDYLEVTNVPSLDIDNDGIANAWDFDNDGDGVNDTTDLSPLTKTGPNDSFHFDIATNGRPCFITIQLKPSHSEYLKLYGQFWDWPDKDRDGSVQDWDNSKEDVAIFPVLQLSVNHAPAAIEVLFNGIIVDGNTISVPLIPVADHGNSVAFAGRIPYPSTTPQNLTIDAKLIWKVISYNDPNSSVLGEQTLLAAYNDSFSLTGMTVEQSEGTDVGLFYDSDINQTMAANLLLAYQFLRNPDNHLGDMQAVLDANNIAIQKNLSTFAHRDAALVSLANQRIPDVLESMPADANLPVVTLIEDRTASADLSEFNSIGPGRYAINLTSQSVMTTKSLRTDWYNTASQKSMETEQVMAEIQTLGLNEQASYSLQSMMLYWNTGEQTLQGPGILQPDVSNDFQQVYGVTQNVLSYGLTSFELLSMSRVSLQAYKSFKLLQSKGWSAAADAAGSTKIGDLKKFKTWVKQCNNVADNSKWFSRISDVFDGLDAASMFIDVGFSAYSLIAISQMSNLSAIAVNNAVLQVTLQYYYSCMMFMVGAIPYVGWLIALATELSDLFGDWSDDFISWLVSCISDVDFVPTMDVDIVGDPNITFTDKDNNGADVGDRIDYRSRLKSTISGIQNYWAVMVDSEIYPYYKIYAPTGSSSVTGSPYQRQVVTPFGNLWLPITTSQYSFDRTVAWRASEYESGVWVEPGTGMPNFPVYVELNSVWELWYAWSWYSFVFWDWGWQHEESREKGQTALGGFTMYVDIMPATLEDFVNWKGIGQLDCDGDGLLNSEEPTNYWGETSETHPWRYDTDSDGLNDKFEIDNGLNPLDFDTDGDSLIDWFEVQFGTDPNNPDTDKDGLFDQLEIAGWIIKFDYAGQTFTTRVYSDPTIPDTDGDGVGDYQEYFSGLNPRSQDTNGDGIKDIDKSQIPQDTVEFVKRIFFDGERANASTDIAVDDAGFVYESIAGYDDAGGNIRKYDNDLNWVSTWSVNNKIARNMLIDNEHQFLYLSHPYDLTPTIDGDMRSNILTLSLVNGSQVGTFWGTRNEIEGPFALALERDSLGNFYVGRSAYWFHYSFDHPEIWKKGAVSLVDIYDSNKSYVSTWGQFAANGEVDKLACVTDIAYNPVSGLLYLCDISVGGMEVSRDDRIAMFTPAGQYQGFLPDYHKDGLHFEYQWLSSVAVDSEGYVYIGDPGNYRIHKVDPLGLAVTSWGGVGQQEGQFDGTVSKVIVDKNKNVFVLETGGGDYAWMRIHKFRQVQNDPNTPVVVVDNNPDRDGDGILNDIETAGWNITFTDPNGMQILAVTSDPMLMDTDLDGLSDSQEHQLGTNPRNPDTDKDGAGDYTELQTQTDPKDDDSDHDGLPDGTESTFGSNPKKADTEGDGLTDSQEFALGANPNSADTDNDGLADANEVTLNANLLSPDSDGDFMFDGQEAAAGTDPNNSDTDNDGLNDGMEVTVQKTSPTDADSDNDGVNDGMEIDLRIDPLSSDTDGDGILDGQELNEGTNPSSGDTDHDGIPDSQDNNTNLAPDVSKAKPSQEYLWPADNKYIPITINGVTDPDKDPVQIAIVSVTSDEPSLSGCKCKPHSKHTCDKNKFKPDAYVSDDGTLYLKAHRDGKGNGRVYEINFMAGDNKGGVTPGKVQVKVPHDKRGRNYICKDDGQKYLLWSSTPNQAPNVSKACPSKPVLSPANCKFERITIKGVTDPESDKVCITITDVTSDEPAAFSKKDLRRIDAFILGTDSVALRAECDGKGNGRVYEIAFKAKDCKGNQSSGTVKVSVPRWKNTPAIDDGQKYDPLPDWKCTK